MSRGDDPPKKRKSVLSRVLLALLVVIVVLPLGAVMTCMALSAVRVGSMLLRGNDAPSNMASARAAAPQIPTSTAPEMNAPGVVTYPPGEDPRSVTVSVANFTKETRIDECDDVTVTLPPEMTGPEARTKAHDNMLAWIAQRKKKEIPGLVKIAKPCSEQFPTIPVLATCTVHQQLKADSGAVAYQDIAASYYNIDTLTRADAYMKDCFDLQGDWQALSKDSDEYREAVRARGRREVEKLQNSLGK